MDENGSVATAGSQQLVTEEVSDSTDGRIGADPVADAPPGKSVIEAPEWPRLGATARTSGAVDIDIDPMPGEGAGEPVDVNLEIEDGETTLFEAAIGAFHAGEYQRAESLFLEEAQRTLASAPQRAAISYRQAALAAGQMGNVDASDHWMRLAGREYLRVTEDDRTPLPFIREAAVMAAKCFLSVENLHVASKGLRRAQAIETVLRADDDLMAEGSDPPVVEAPENDAGPTPTRAELRIERRATVRPGTDLGPDRSAARPSGSASPSPPGHEQLTPADGDDPPTGHRRWLHRVRHPRPARHVA